jgi:hypothetical protein
MFERPPGTNWKLSDEQAREARRLLRAIVKDNKR